MLNQVLPGRLTDEQARTLGREYARGSVVPPYKPLFAEHGSKALEDVRGYCEERPDVHLGMWIWPDGIWTPIPRLAPGESMEAVLLRWYTQARDAAERNALACYPAEGTA